MNRLISLLLLVPFAMSCTEKINHDVVIQNVHFFDGYEDKGIVNIAINADTIAAISSDKLSGDSLIEGHRKFVMPGMVNAHVHVSSLSQLKEGYPLGITALLNMHTGLEERELKWKKVSKDSAGFSELYGAGHAATVPGGHPNQFSPEMETINDSLTIENWLEHRIIKQVDYIKIVREHHEWMGYPPLPTLDFEQIEKLILLAHQNKLKAVVHSNTVEEMLRIAAFEPDGFVHMPDYKEDYPIPESYFEAIAASGAFIIPTSGISLKPMDGAPPFVTDWVKNNLLDAQQRAEIIKKYHEYGILIVAGTDAQEGQMDFSTDFFLELELYKMAGLSNLEILKTATGNASLAFGLPIGQLRVGSNATMVLLKENPLDNIENLKSVEQVWKDGKFENY